LGDRNPTRLPRLVFVAWVDGDRAAAEALATMEAVGTLFDPELRGGWKSPTCAVRGSKVRCELTRSDAVGPMVWTIRAGPSGLYILDSVAVPPIPLDVGSLRSPSWGVFASIGPDGYPQLATAVTVLQQMGLESTRISQGQMSCYRGAATALQVPAGYHAVVAFLGTRSEADAFAAMLPTPAEGVVRTTLLCG
jgi:hypothetical protein